MELDMEVEVEEVFRPPVSWVKAEIDIPSTRVALTSSSGGDIEIEVVVGEVEEVEVEVAVGTRDWIMVCSLVSLSSFSWRSIHFLRAEELNLFLTTKERSEL